MNVGAQHRFAWLRLNSDALFIVLLTFGVSILNFVFPQRDDVLVHFARVENPTPLFFLQNFGYLFGGAILLYSLLVAHPNTEVIGRTVIGATIVVSIYRSVVAFGVDQHMLSDLTILGIYTLTTTLRVTALYNKTGIVFRLPPTTGE